MTTNVEGQHTPDGSGGESLAEFDIKLREAREAMYLQATRYRSLPIDKNLDRFLEAANAVQQALGELVEHVIYGDDFETAEARARAVQTLLCDEELKRNETFNAVLQKEQFESDNFSDPTFIETAVSAIDEYEFGEPATFFMELVKNPLTEDIIEFGNTINETKTAKTIKFAKRAGFFALDVTKIAGAVTVGVVVANKISKNK